MPSRIESMAVTMLVVVVVVMAMLNVDGVAASPIESRNAPSPAQEAAQAPYFPIEARESRRTKRSYVHSSCKGRYSQNDWDELSYVCKDCNNVFREHGLQADCRKGCFASDTFSDCLKALHKDVDYYQAIATSLRGS